VLGVVFNGDTQSAGGGMHTYYGQDGGASADETTWRSSAKRAWARVGRG
jgi:hypothetical protein